MSAAANDLIRITDNFTLALFSLIEDALNPASIHDNLHRVDVHWFILFSEQSAFALRKAVLVNVIDRQFVFRHVGS